jgi:hypothetical protein
VPARSSRSSCDPAACAVSGMARLTFIQLWLVADDAGRLVAHPRLLAHQLYPGDAEAAGLLPGWLAELERENCIERYRRQAGIPAHRQLAPAPEDLSFDAQPSAGPSRGFLECVGRASRDARERKRKATQRQGVDPARANSRAIRDASGNAREKSGKPLCVAHIAPFHEGFWRRRIFSTCRRRGSARPGACWLARLRACWLARLRAAAVCPARSEKA